MMDRRYIDEHQIADKYLHGRLSAEEAATFEEYFIDKPELLEQMELDTIFRDGLKDSLAPNQEPDLFNQSSASAFGAGNSWFAIAASTAFVALCGSVFFNVVQSEKNDQLSAILSKYESGQANIAYLELSPMRSAAQEFKAAGTLSLKPELSSAFMKIRLSHPEKPAYDVRISKHSDKSEVITFSAVVPMGAGDLYLLLPVSAFSSGDYWAQVLFDNESIVEIPFSVSTEE